MSSQTKPYAQDTALTTLLAILARKWALFNLPPAPETIAAANPHIADTTGKADRRYKAGLTAKRQFLDIGGTGLALAKLSGCYIPPIRYLAVIDDQATRDTWHKYTQQTSYYTAIAPPPSEALVGYGPFDRVYARLGPGTRLAPIFAAMTPGARFMFVIPRDQHGFPLPHLVAAKLKDFHPLALDVASYAPPSFYQSRLTVKELRAYLRQTANMADCTLIVARGRLR